MAEFARGHLSPAIGLVVPTVENVEYQLACKNRSSIDSIEIDLLIDRKTK